MNDAEQLISSRHRFNRYISPTKLRAELGRKKGECTWCGGPARRHCSLACKQEVYVRAGLSDGGVLQRDKGCCSICGLNCQYVQDILRAERRRMLTRPPDAVEILKMTESFAKLTKISWYGTPYEIDHILPVSEGGGCCSADNLRLVCKQCHRTETKKLRRRMRKS